MADDWDLDSEGRVILFPLDGWDARTLPQGHVAVRLAYATTPEALTTGDFSTVQLVLTGDLALAFAQALSRAATTPYFGRPQGSA